MDMLKKPNGDIDQLEHVSGPLHTNPRDLGTHNPCVSSVLQFYRYEVPQLNVCVATMVMA